MKGFIDFIREQGVVGLAVGFILGGVIAKLVSSLVTDIINPIVGVALGATKNLDGAYLTIGAARFAWGHFLSTLIDSLIVLAVVYFGVKLLRIDKNWLKKK